jgi:hypothetical protein
MGIPSTHVPRKDVTVTTATKSHRRASAATPKALIAPPPLTNAQKFAQEFPDVAAWIESSAGFNFADSLGRQVNEKGKLSVPQIEAARRCAMRAAETQRIAASAPPAEVALLEQSFATAKENGLKHPKMRIGNLKFNLAGPKSRNQGAIYAKDTDTGVYLGKFAGGLFTRSRDCTDEQQAKLIGIAKDPLGSLIAHGKLTGNCGICSLPLSDPKSVKRGIGPVCAAKYGWR